MPVYPLRDLRPISPIAALSFLIFELSTILLHKIVVSVKRLNILKYLSLINITEGIILMNSLWGGGLKSICV